jgi:DNA polymerase-3 subunit delta'
MFFRQVIGQENIKKSLLQSVKDSRVSHAQLFAGSDGSGNLALALAYARYVSCRNKQEGDSCGECPSCKKYSKLIHPDLHFVFPVVKTPKFKDPVSDNFLNEWRAMVNKNPYFNLDQWFSFIGAENAQGLIYSHESEEIIRKLNLKPFESEFKVMIIWMPEKMHVACSNKLLKMIEEPPSKTLFLLVAENEENIITTIRSRCQLIKIPPIDDVSVETALSTVQGAEGANIESIVHLARGNYRRALELLQPDEMSAFNLERFKELMRFSYGRKFLDLFRWSEVLSAVGREKQKSFLLYSMKLLRENFVSNLKNNALVFMADDEADFSKRFAPFINERNIIQLSKLLEEAFNHVSMNGNPRIIFTDMAFKVTKLIRK